MTSSALIRQFCNKLDYRSPNAGSSALYSDIVSLRPLWPVVPPLPPFHVCNRLRELGLWAVCRLFGGSKHLRFKLRRGQRSGNHVRQSQKAFATTSTPSSSLPSIRFGCINIRSLNNKFDDAIELFRDHHLAVLCITETWLDIDSPVVGRLRSSGYSVIDSPRPRIRDDLSVNHGGVAVVASSGWSLSPLPLGSSPSTFEVVASHLMASNRRFAVIVVYRPGSQQITSKFFDELAAILEQLAVLNVELYVVGDFNVRLDRPDDPHAVQLRSVFSSYGLTLNSSGPTRRDGILDLVASRSEVTLSVVDVDFSDHRLLHWSVNDNGHSTPPISKLTRCWRQLDISLFRDLLSSSELCQPSAWSLDVDSAASQYNDVINHILDDILPVRHHTCRPRPTNPWFDAECRAAKRFTRRLERAALAADRRVLHSSTDGDVTAVKVDAEAARSAWHVQRRVYRQLRHQKCTAFWSTKMEAASNPRDMWSLVDRLLGRDQRSSPSVDAETLASFFCDKVDRIRSATANFPPPTYQPVPHGAVLPFFSSVTSSEVAASIARLPDKSSAADPISVSILKQVSDLLVPFLTHLINRSIELGQFPASFKTAFLTPIIKKPGLDASDPASYRPISNLPVISKLLERIVAQQLVEFLNKHDLLPATQSGFRRGFSTESAITKVLSDLLDAVDSGDTAALTLLDLSAAFDTVDYAILVQRLNVSFGVEGSALQWFRTYLYGRKQYVRCGGNCSKLSEVVSGVPQGSVLGPILFIIYTGDLQLITAKHGLSLHQYADDSQIYGSCRSSDISSFTTTISNCVNDVLNWMRSNRLQLNTEKTEFMWCATARRAPTLPKDPVNIAGASVQPVSTVRDLGVFIDSDLGAATHVKRTVSRCFYALRQLRQLRRFVSDVCFQRLVVSLIHSRLDYGNFSLVGLPVHLQLRLQSVLNAAARLTFKLRRYDHVTDALSILHWLRVPQRIDFKLGVTAYCSLNGAAPPYLNVLQRVCDIPGRRQLRSSSSLQLQIPAFRLSTIGKRSFSCAASSFWNSLPHFVQSSPTLPIFRRRLKTHLFRLSYPEIIV